MHSNGRAFWWYAVLGGAGILLGVSPVSAQEGAIDLGSVLRKFSADQEARQGALSTVPPQAPVPSNRVADTEPFVLLGVVISDHGRLALLQPAKTPGAGSLVKLGDSLEDHRLVDVQADHVTLEGRGGEQFLVKLASGHAGGSTATPAAAPAANRATQMDDRTRAEKEARQRRIGEDTARDKARALAERFQLGTMPPPTR